MTLAKDHAARTQDASDPFDLFLSMLHGQRRLKIRRAPVYVPRERPQPPANFDAELPKLKGMELTAGDVYARITGRDCTHAEAMQCAQWLRDRGFMPRRTAKGRLYQL